MYSLPITAYSDYWRATRAWSSYLGGFGSVRCGYAVFNSSLRQCLEWGRKPVRIHAL